MNQEHSDKEVSEKKTYSVGTLKYTKFGLFTLFSWLLWGDFCYHIMEKVGHSILPLQLQSIGMSNFTLSLIATILPNTLGFVVGPTVSYKSDRYRSKWGRRIPFMALTAPFLCFFLAGMGYTEDIAVWLRDSEAFKNFHILGFHVTAHAALLFIVGFLVLGFAFFNEFVGSVYWYLFADVVPREYLGRFMGLFRMITSVANIFFMAFVFPHAETHAKYIYLGGALLYFVGFGLMCWRVKEGEYPPEEESEEEKKPGFVAKAKIYINECFFSHPIYVNYYLFQAVFAMGVGGNFVLLFGKQIGLTLTQMGSVNIFMNVVHFFVTYPAGVIADKFHPMRLMLFMAFMSIPGAFLAFFYKTDFPSYVLLGILWLPVKEIVDAVTYPLSIRLLPRKRYGQFSSAKGMFRQGGRMIGAGGMALCIDYFQDYAYYMVWIGCVHIVALYFLIKTYYYWKVCGGDDYEAPMKKKIEETVTHHDSKTQNA